MDIHKPKPFHNWREFLKEYGIIVLGVLTALGLEQAVEWAHHRSQVDEAIEDLRQQSNGSRDAMAFDVATLKGEIADADHDLAALGSCALAVDPAVTRPLAIHHLFTPVGTAWQGIRDSALLPLMPKEIASDYSIISGITVEIQPILEDRGRIAYDASAAVDTIQGGLADRADCQQAVFQLHRLQRVQRGLLREIVFFQVSNDQILRGEHLDIATARARLEQADGAAGRD
jgi:hypothetical protein